MSRIFCQSLMDAGSRAFAQLGRVSMRRALMAMRAPNQSRAQASVQAFLDTVFSAEVGSRFFRHLVLRFLVAVSASDSPAASARGLRLAPVPIRHS